ncbi:MAG: hypothetical protein CM1200mP1_07620 [Candidatus Neomarinimicrobiota bacterium]|nr:MAG: hypothetical protein CM1200mP1_07620 [Candidatus Neomarinimicrobiota bacterium]
MLKRIVFLTFLISLAYGQDVEADSAIEGYEQAEEELLESIKEESNKSEKKRKRKLANRDTYQALTMQTLTTTAGIFVAANLPHDVMTTYSTIALVYPTAKLVSIGKRMPETGKSRSKRKVLKASVVGAIPIVILWLQLLLFQLCLHLKLLIRLILKK